MMLKEVLLHTSDTGKRIEMTAETNSILFYNEDGFEVFRLDDDIDSSQSGTPLGGIRMLQPNGRVAYGTGNGFFANGGGMTFLPGSTGIPNNASIVGLLFERNSDPNGISAAVVGRDGSNTGNSKSYAAYFMGRTYLGGAIETLEGSTVRTGINGIYRMRQYQGANLVPFDFKYVNGLLVSVTPT